MKKGLFLVLGLVLVGCAYKGQTFESYIDEPENILRDPHYASYQDQADMLEKDYLSKKISYAEYMEKKSELENKYSKEVKERESIVAPAE
jgi:hypothetical protein